MIFVWRGYGWLIPIVAFGSFLLSQIVIDALFGEAFYRMHEWPQFAAITFASILIGLLGYWFNYKKRVMVIDEETGIKRRSSSHTLFFIPMEFWAIIIPVVFIWASNQSAHQDSQDLGYLAAPLINDKYIVDFTKIYDVADKKYKYGIINVIGVIGEDVEVVFSNMVYNKKSGPRKDIRENKTLEKNYFTSESVVFKINELIQFKETDVIDSVTRN